MADTTTSTNTVKMTAEFGDGTQQIISQNTPTNENLVEKINAFSSYIAANNILKSEKSEATVTRIKSAKLVQRTEIDYDLG